MKSLLLASVLFTFHPFVVLAQSLSDMTSPEIDDPAKEWCFLAKSTTVIGVPYQPDVTQVTFDGALFTRSAELCFFWGEQRRPILARQKTFLDGWMPIVEYEWQDGDLRYGYEAFAQTLEGEDTSNSVNFARIRVTNQGKESHYCTVTAALRHRLDDSRFGGGGFDAASDYVNRGFGAYRNGDLIYCFPSQGLQSPNPETFHPNDAAALFGGASYRRLLDPGQATEFDFTMPRVPVHPAEARYLAKLKKADYGTMRKRTIDFWKQAVIGHTEFRIPEARVQNAQRASLVHMMLATRERDGKRFQTDGLPYPDLFLTSNVQAEMAYDFLGRPHDYEGSLDEVLARQGTQGIFMDTSLPQNAEPLIAAQGQTLHALSYHYLLTHDDKFARRVYPAVAKGVRWIIEAQHKDKYGLMPPSWPYDNEMILGRYTSHNLWCLLGLRSAIRMARDLGELEDAADWTAFEEQYSKSIVRALHASALPDGSVPPGLYDYKTGNAARAGFKEYQTNQDWENMLLVAPTEVLSPDDPLLAETLDRLHRDKFREGVMTYRNGQHLHQYITTNVLEQEMAIGRQEQALIDLYHVLLHCGSTHEGFENLVEPWTRQVNLDCPPPHAWAAMKTALVIRNALIVERGGKAGLHEEQRELHLFSLLSPAWVTPGTEVGFRNAPCEMGSLSASMRFTSHGADLKLDAHWRKAPKAVVVHIPWFVEARSYEIGGKITTVKPATEVIRLDPSDRQAYIEWRIKPGLGMNALQNLLLAYRREPGFRLVDGEGLVTPGREGILSDAEKALPPSPLSFTTVLKAYEIEYRRRFDEFVKKGGRPLRIGS
ncbi:MAG: hypothetical protein P4L46_13570 [Fimbriimonas sp.]|nr:hypothetical protein [Fimbriimonas sp.]